MVSNPRIELGRGNSNSSDDAVASRLPSTCGTAKLCSTLTKTKMIHERRLQEQVPKPVVSFQQPVRLKATNNVGEENLTVQLSCLYAVRRPCCWHAVWWLSFFPLDLSPPGYGWVRVRSLPGPKDRTPDGPYSTATSRPVALHCNGI